MTTELKSLLNSRLPNDNWGKDQIKQPPIDAVDQMADYLVKEYSNPDFRRWYCGVIYEFGIPKVQEWIGRAKEGREPARLFNTYVSQCRKFHQKQP